MIATAAVMARVMNERIFAAIIVCNISRGMKHLRMVSKRLSGPDLRFPFNSHWDGAASHDFSWHCRTGTTGVARRMHRARNAPGWPLLFTRVGSADRCHWRSLIDWVLYRF